MYVLFFQYLFFFVSVPKLKDLVKKSIINQIKHRELLKCLPIPSSLIREMMDVYAKWVTFPRVKLSLCDSRAARFMLLEYDIKYGHLYSKEFLGIIKYNEWIQNLFSTAEAEWHFVVKYYAHIRKLNDVKYLYVCPTCFNSEKRNVEFVTYYRHHAFKSQECILFQEMFSPTMWCHSSRQSALYELNSKTTCIQRYGKRITNVVKILSYLAGTVRGETEF